MFDLCTLGHITLDKIQTVRSVKYMPGGTAYYFSKALKNLDIRFLLVTAVADEEQYIIDDLQMDKINVIKLHSDRTVYFENIYPENQDHREQNVLETANPFTSETFPAVQAQIFHLGPLLNNDISPGLYPALAAKGIVSLDIQGLLRYTENKKVYYKELANKEDILRHVTILKANEFEMEILTGTADVHKGARYLAAFGIKEVLITCGSKGSVVLVDGQLAQIPAISPTQTIDTTGCGDTYMAGYLYKKIKGGSPETCGLFGAAMATLKIQSFGPFNGTLADVDRLINQSN